jgi:hypothetical protein
VLSDLPSKQVYTTWLVITLVFIDTVGTVGVSADIYLVRGLVAQYLPQRIEHYSRTASRSGAIPTPFWATTGRTRS